MLEDLSANLGQPVPRQIQMDQVGLEAETTWTNGSDHVLSQVQVSEADEPSKHRLLQNFNAVFCEAEVFEDSRLAKPGWVDFGEGVLVQAEVLQILEGTEGSRGDARDIGTVNGEPGDRGEAVAV